MPTAAGEVVHDQATGRFELGVDGHLAELVYRLDGTTMVITHTGVPEAIGGRGIAARLVEAAFAQARAAGWKVAPACSYARVWADRHPAVADLLA